MWVMSWLMIWSCKEREKRGALSILGLDFGLEGERKGIMLHAKPAQSFNFCVWGSTVKLYKGSLTWACTHTIFDEVNGFKWPSSTNVDPPLNCLGIPVATWVIQLLHKAVIAMILKRCYWRVDRKLTIKQKNAIT